MQQKHRRQYDLQPQTQKASNLIYMLQLITGSAAVQSAAGCGSPALQAGGIGATIARPPARAAAPRHARRRRHRLSCKRGAQHRPADKSSFLFLFEILFFFVGFTFGSDAGIHLRQIVGNPLLFCLRVAKRFTLYLP